MPRSLNEPVGIMNSSLNKVAAPSQSPAMSGVPPSPRLTALDASTPIAAA